MTCLTRHLHFFSKVLFLMALCFSLSSCNLTQIKEQLKLPKLPKLPEFLIKPRNKEENDSASKTVQIQPEPEPKERVLAETNVSEKTANIHKLFAQIYINRVQQSPMLLTKEGRNMHQGHWDDFSEKGAFKKLRFAKEHLSALNKELAGQSLSKDHQLSYEIMKYELESLVSLHNYRHHLYEMTPYSGVYIDLPTFLIQDHRVDDITDANNYISRLEGLPEAITQSIENLKQSESKGLIPPKDLYPVMINISEKIISGTPFTSGSIDNPIYEDFKRKVSKLEIYEESKDALVKRSKTILIKKVKPSYQKLINYLKELSLKAPTQYGLVHQEQGQAFYEKLLNYHTTTQTTAKELHNLGLISVSKHQNDLLQMSSQMSYKGVPEGFWDFYRRKPKQKYTNDQEGRNAFIQNARDRIILAESRLKKLFPFSLDSTLKVRPVEPFKESISPITYYKPANQYPENVASLYINLNRINQQEVHQLPVTIFQETLPGHHLQNSFSQSIKKLPKFRRYTRYPVFENGWSLYATTLADELKLYKTREEEFAHKANLLKFSSLAVVDTGIHSLGWSKAQALQYLKLQTPMPLKESNQWVQYIAALPGQSVTTYVGYQTILELKVQAKNSLKVHYRDQDFHHNLLKDGSLPLPILKKTVLSQLQDLKSPI